MKTLLFLQLFIICTSAFAQLDRTVTIMSGGVPRTFDVHLPSINPPQNLPVLFCFHGTGGSSAGMAATSGFNTLSDGNNFIAVYPQGVQIGADIQWNVYVDDQPGHAGVGDANAPDDIRFTRDMIDKLVLDFNIDRKRVYASGLSNGAFMCYALSMFAYNEIKAIAPVAGNLWADQKYLETLLASGTVTPMPVMHVHGTADNVVDYPDPDNMPKPYEEYPLFVSARGCAATTYSDVVPIMHLVDKLVFCPPPVEVSLIRITGMGHAWTNGEYATSKEIVKFFNLIQESSGVLGGVKQKGFHIASSVADLSLRIVLDNPATAQLLNTLGELVYEAKQQTGSFEIQTQSYGNGLYLLHVISSSGKIFSEKIMIQH